MSGKSKYARRRAGGESHADIMSKSRDKTQSMRDELAQIKGRIADKDKASVIRGARKAGGLQSNTSGESYADRRERIFGSKTSPKVTANPTKPGDRESVLRGKSSAEKASVLAQARRSGGLRTR